MAALSACGVASTSSRCQQQWIQPAARTSASLRAQCSAFAGGGSLAPQRLPLAALHRRRAPAAARSIATVDGGSGGPAGAGGNDKVTVEQLVRGAWRSLCSIRPPKSLWRTVGALVLGGQALVRILQGELVRSGGRGWPLTPPCCQRLSMHEAACLLLLPAPSRSGLHSCCSATACPNLCRRLLAVALVNRCPTDDTSRAPTSSLFFVPGPSSSPLFSPQARFTGRTQLSSWTWWARAPWASACSPLLSWAWCSPSNSSGKWRRRFRGLECSKCLLGQLSPLGSTAGS